MIFIFMELAILQKYFEQMKKYAIEHNIGISI